MTSADLFVNLIAKKKENCSTSAAIVINIKLAYFFLSRGVEYIIGVLSSSGWTSSPGKTC